MNPVPFEVASEELEGGVFAFAIRGELDLNTASQLEEPLQRALDAEAPVLIDLSGCEFIDSTGIALIVRAWQRLDRDGNGDSGEHMVLCCANDQVQRLLELTGVKSSISIFEKRDDAISTLRG